MFIILAFWSKYILDHKPCDLFCKFRSFDLHFWTVGFVAVYCCLLKLFWYLYFWKYFQVFLRVDRNMWMCPISCLFYYYSVSCFLLCFGFHVFINSVAYFSTILHFGIRCTGIFDVSSNSLILLNVMKVVALLYLFYHNNPLQSFSPG
jgi:hypothetical protein